MYVHGYRAGDTDSERVTRITRIGRNRYEHGQVETVIKACTLQHPRPRWYVAFGGDYIPANAEERANIEDRCQVPRDLRTKSESEIMEALLQRGILDWM